MKEKMIESHITQYQSMDYTGTLKISSLFNEFSNIATVHAESINLWNPAMMEKYGWIVSKYHVEVKKYCHFNQYDLITSIGKASKVIFPRYFAVNVKGENIIVASSIWTLIDLNNRRITIPSRAGFTGIEEYDENPPCDKPGNIEDVEYTKIGERKVLYSDLDTNRHMNNTKYLDWACDLIDYTYYENHYIQMLDIYFMHEIGPNDLVELYLSQNQNTYYIKGIVNETDCFKIRLHFEEKTGI